MSATSKDSRVLRAHAPAGRLINLCLPLLLAVVVILFVINSAHAQQSKKSPKAAKSAKRQDATAAAPRVGLEPKALEIIKAACDRLAAAKTMSFTAIVTYEHPSLIGPALAYTTRSEVIMQRPDKLRVITPADGPASEFYYDGTRMLAVSPSEKLMATAEAPPTIDAMLKAAYDRAAIYFPFADVIVADPYKDIAEGLKTAFYIGQSRVVGGVVTEMVAYVNDDVFVQAWVGVEDKLPRMLRAVYRADPSRLRHQMELSNWKLDGDVLPGSFTPASTESLAQIPFVRPDVLPPGLIPPKPQGKPKVKPQGK